MYERDPKLFVKVQHDLTIGMRAEPVAKRFQFRADLLEAVKFAIDDNVNSFVLIGQRLVAGN
jgi:hypothetical protein